MSSQFENLARNLIARSLAIARRCVVGIGQFGA
jgi:hypothetical protein